MREKTAAFGVGADTAEIEVVNWRGNGLVECWTKTLLAEGGGAVGIVVGANEFVVALDARVPRDTEAVDVENAVTGFEELIIAHVLRVVGYQAGKIMFVNLFDERMLRRDENVLEETWLRGGDVCEPAAHLEISKVYILSRLEIVKTTLKYVNSDV